MPRSIIIGSGLFGLTAAITLRSRGWQVALLDQGRIPHADAASTDISKVVRMDYGRDALHTELGERSLKQWRAWNVRWGEELFHEDGFLVMGREAMQPGSFEHESYEFLQQRGHTLRRMDSESLAHDHPVWSSSLYPDGYFNPQGGWVESGRVMLRLKQDALAAGIVIHEGVEFRRLMSDLDGTVRGIEATDGRRWSADNCMVAAGAWTPSLLPHLQNVMWATGQTVLHFKPQDVESFRPPAFPVWAADIGRTGWYGFPANRDGIVKVANHGLGYRVDPWAPREVAASEEQRFRSFLRETFPSLAEAPLVAARLCLYCDTFDGAFWIDHDPEHPGLVVAAGDSGHAFKFAPVLGDIIADAIERRENKALERYRWRESAGTFSDGARAQ
jgi:sarcosine oxidase / L-pipecolate oxidase